MRLNRGRTMRWVGYLLAVVTIVGALAGGICAYQSISASLEAERTLHAALLTVELLNDYESRHPGQWPRSWTDLEKLPKRESGGMFEWPKDSAEVQRYVSIDFSADPRRLAEQSVNDFDSVRPIGPYYEFKDYGSVAALLNSFRKHNK